MDTKKSQIDDLTKMTKTSDNKSLVNSINDKIDVIKSNKDILK